MAPTRNGVHIQGVNFFEVLQNKKALADIPFIEQNAGTMLDGLY